MTFHENWFTPESCEVLADLARTVVDVPGRIVEIGSWEGRSTVAIANAVAPRPVDAVDTWQGCPDDVSEQIAAGRDVHAQWQANVAALTAGNVTAHRMDWRTYHDQHRTPCAFLFVDATHTYDEVYDNLAAFAPLMTPGGIMCGDDAHHPPVLHAVLDAFPDEREQLQQNGPLWIRHVPR